MSFLYSNIAPLSLKDNQTDIQTIFSEKAAICDSIVIAVGYVSKNSLIELDRIIRKNHVNHITLILGMYYIEGFPESIFRTAMRIDRQWSSERIGEIRVIKSMKFHGKIYLFFKNNRPIAGIVGSHNLGSLFTDANNRRQYEFSSVFESEQECNELAHFLSSIEKMPISFPLAGVNDALIIHEENDKLHGVEDVTKITEEEVMAYRAKETAISFEIPLKVPGIPGDKNAYLGSNINVCYASGRHREWWETELIVDKSIRTNPNYPSPQTPFFVITDDGWRFMMRSGGSKGIYKNLYSHPQLKLLGYWLKGRLAASGIAEPVGNVQQDLAGEKKGVISYEKLKEYGRTSLTLTKTSLTALDENGIERDIWTVSFLPANVK